MAEPLDLNDAQPRGLIRRLHWRDWNEARDHAIQELLALDEHTTPADSPALTSITALLSDGDVIMVHTGVAFLGALQQLVAYRTARATDDAAALDTLVPPVEIRATAEAWLAHTAPLLAVRMAADERAVFAFRAYLALQRTWPWPQPTPPSSPLRRAIRNARLIAHSGALSVYDVICLPFAIPIGASVAAVFAQLNYHLRLARQAHWLAQRATLAATVVSLTTATVVVEDLPSPAAHAATDAGAPASSPRSSGTRAAPAPSGAPLPGRQPSAMSAAAITASAAAARGPAPGSAAISTPAAAAPSASPTSSFNASVYQCLPTSPDDPLCAAVASPSADPHP